MKRESVLSLMWKVLKAFFFLPVWYAQRWTKRDASVWVFGAWRGERYADNSRAFFEYVHEMHPEIKAFWIARTEAVYQHLVALHLPVVMADSKEGRKILRHAGWAMISWGIQDDVDARYLNGVRYMYLWHGMPLKMIGKDEMNFKHPNAGWWKHFKTRFREIVLPYECQLTLAVKSGRLYTLSTSPFFTPFLQSAWQLDLSHIWEIGTPRNDKLFGGVKEKFTEALDQKYDHPIKVFYMPTFRDQSSDSVAGFFNPFEHAGFQAESFDRMLEENNMVFLYKGHFMDQDNRFSFKDRMLTVGDDDYDDLYSFLKDMDILVTDYSSVYFDFLLCRKPVVLFPFDLEEYVAHSRPFYFDYDRMEAKRVTTWMELEQVLADHAYAAPSEKTVTLFNNPADGRCCERLFARIKDLS